MVIVFRTSVWTPMVKVAAKTTGSSVRRIPEMLLARRRLLLHRDDHRTRSGPPLAAENESAAVETAHNIGV
jgi:hypothetical protein